MLKTIITVCHWHNTISHSSIKVALQPHEAIESLFRILGQDSHQKFYSHAQLFAKIFMAWENVPEIMTNNSDGSFLYNESNCPIIMDDFAHIVCGQPRFGHLEWKYFSKMKYHWRSEVSDFKGSLVNLRHAIGMGKYADLLGRIVKFTYCGGSEVAKRVVRVEEIVPNSSFGQDARWLIKGHDLTKEKLGEDSYRNYNTEKISGKIEILH